MAKATRDYIVLFINGRRYEIRGQQAFLMLAHFLRYEIKLVGTKVVCAEGDCGACTVLCYRSNKEYGPDFLPINACIITVAQLDGCHILTVESLKREGALSLVQEALVNHHGSQCGFCTPGFAMAMTALFEKSPSLTAQKVKNSLTGNLCRCTGYLPLIEAALAIDPSKIKPLHERYVNKERYQELKDASFLPVYLEHDGQLFCAPKNLTEAIAFKQSHPTCRMLGGATDMGVSVNKGKTSLECIMSLHLIDELLEISETPDHITVGARVSLEQVRRFTKTTVTAFSRFLNIFASPQIKNIATLVGNVANGSPIGDTLPFLMVSLGRIHCYGPQGARVIAMEELYRAYKELALMPHEIITHVSFDKPKKTQKLKLEKVSQRKDLDISIVNMAFLFEIDAQKNAIEEARIAFGGVHSTVKRLKKTEELLLGKRLSVKLMDQASACMQEEIAPLSDLRGTSSYRRALADSLFRKVMTEVMSSE